MIPSCTCRSCTAARMRLNRRWALLAVGLLLAAVALGYFNKP